MVEIFKFKALNRRVLIVACVNELVGDWAVYIGAVEGQRHENEYMDVAQRGSKVDKEVAEHYFPQFKEKRYRA